MDYPRPQSRCQAVAWWLEDNAIAILATLTAAPVATLVLLYLGACMVDSWNREETYWHTGFTPDCTEHDDTPACYE